MPHHQRGLRAELAAILSVDQYTLEDLVDDPAPPYEPTSTRLAHLIIHAIHHPIEARAVYAFLPVLVLRLFGFAVGQGWLETISQLPSKDRDALLAVVLPDGPLHSFCKQASSLSSAQFGEADMYSSALPVTAVPAVRDMRFEFPVNNLPLATRQALSMPQSAPHENNNGNMAVAMADDHFGAHGYLHNNTSGSAIHHHQQHQQQTTLATDAHTQSYLAPILRPALVSRYGGDVLLLDPLLYFNLCLVASPANKYASDGVAEGTNPVTAKRIKRSTSLPSTRALYNQVLSAYLKASACSPMQRADAAPVIIPAVLDFLFLPFALATPDSIAPAPVPSAAAADAIATVLLSVIPPAPEALELQPGLTIDSSTPPPPAPLASLTTAAAIYRLVPYVVYNALEHLTPGGDATAVPMLAFARVLALHIAPWRSSVRAALRAMLFAKPKRSTSSAAAAARQSQQNYLASNSGNPTGTPGANPSASNPTSAAAMSSALRFGITSAVKGGVSDAFGSMQEASSSLASTVVAHLSAVHRSPERPAPATDARWRAAVADRIRIVDIPLVCAAVVRAAALRVGALSDGARTLATLTDAAQSVRMASKASSQAQSQAGSGTFAARAEELALCLEAIRASVAALDHKGLSKWERGFVPTLAAAVGVRLQTTGGYLQNLSDSAHSVVKDVVGRVSGSNGIGGYNTSPPVNGGQRSTQNGGYRASGGSGSRSRRENSAMNSHGQNMSPNGNGRAGSQSPSPSRSGGMSGSLKRRRVHERRLSLLNGAAVVGEDVGGGGGGTADPTDPPFLGSVWDRPIEGGEFEPMVLFAYWLALCLEPHIGYLPDIRFMGRLWFLLAIAAVSLLMMLVRASVAAR